MTRVVALLCSIGAQLLLLASAVSAQSLEAARAAHGEGRYLEAAEVGETLRTSAGLALAAESLAVYGHYLVGEEEKRALFRRSAQLAQDAIRFDMLNSEAHLQAAHAMGRYAQTIGAVEALREGYATKVREALENALRLNPEMGSAHLSLGTWHTEIVAAVGSFLASLTYGANRKDAISHYERALELEPDEKVVPIEYALGLLRLDETKHREEARALLSRALDMPSKYAFDRILHGRAAARRAELDLEVSETDDRASR